MTKEQKKNKELIKEYPFLLRRNFWTGKPMRDKYDYTVLDELEPGWRKAFGLKMCEEIKQFLVANNYLSDYRVLEVKEKYGTLRWGDNGAPAGLDDILSKYEDLSMCYCQYCGKPTKYYTKGWISYICEDCKNERIKEGASQHNFIELKKSDLPYHIRYSKDSKDEIVYDEVKKFVNEHWSD